MTLSITIENLINMFIISTGIGVCGLSFLQVSSSTHLMKEVRRYFQVFFLEIIAYISLHLVRQMLDGIYGKTLHNVLSIVTFAEILAAGCMTFTISILIMYVSQAKESEKKIHTILIVMLSIHTIISLIGLFSSLIFYFDFFGSIYYFDENNLYHRGKAYILSNIGPVVMLIIDGQLLYSYRKNISKRVRIAFWIYLISPIVAIIIQSFTYGIQFIILATIFSAVYMFAVIISDQNEKYQQQQEVAARLGTELSMATDIQASQLPRLFPAFPNRPEFDVFASMTPAKEVGGDFYDFFMIDDNHIGLVMADVSGKGVPAALFMMVSRVLIKSHLQNGESPKEALCNVNEQLCESNEAQLFVTVWLAVLDIATGKGVAANAGHEHPALCRANGEYELVTYKHSPAVATIEGIPFKEHEFELHPGDSLFVYTDGVAEATNSENVLFGSERMLKALNIDPKAMPEQVLTNVMDGINSFVAGAEQFDDITMLCLRYNGVK